MNYCPVFLVKSGRTDSDAYAPTVQNAQVGSMKAIFWAPVHTQMPSTWQEPCRHRVPTVLLQAATHCKMCLTNFISVQIQPCLIHKENSLSLHQCSQSARHISFGVEVTKWPLTKLSSDTIHILTFSNHDSQWGPKVEIAWSHIWITAWMSNQNGH